MVETQLKTLELLRNKVRHSLDQRQISYEVDYEDGTITARQGAAAVVVKFMDWGEHAVVKLLSPIVLNVERITPELTRFLVEKNNQVLFGKFTLDVEDESAAIWFMHALLADSLDEEGVAVVVDSLIKVASEFTDQIWEMASVA